MVVASLLWSGTGTCLKILLHVSDPAPIMFLRLCVASIILIPILVKYNTVRWIRILKDIAPISLLAAFNFLVYIYALKRIPADTAAIMYTMTPLLTVIISRFTIGERTTKTKIIGILLGFVGMLIVLMTPARSVTQSGNSDMIGNILMISAVLAWTIFGIESRRLTAIKHYSPITVTSVTMITSCIAFGILTAFTTSLEKITPLFSGLNILLILYLGIFATCVTFFLHQWTTKYTSAVTGTLNNYLTPVFAFIINAVFLGETLSVAFLMGSTLVFFGTFITTAPQLVKHFAKNI